MHTSSNPHLSLPSLPLFFLLQILQLLNNPGDTSTSRHAQKCLLWDAVEERHAREVKEAAEKAMQEYKHDHPDIDESAIKVDLPEVPEGQDLMVLAVEQEEEVEEEGAWMDEFYNSDSGSEWG
ncbi:hypothetical protein BYT27DRAFT_7336150 [Phlegmacium glaucopus]|nr:hypothetical protein BYT27DRAFT_7336150 [Phlegmacium glaucopus]